jgi:hypothetical protein
MVDLGVPVSQHRANMGFFLFEKLGYVWKGFLPGVQIRIDTYIAFNCTVCPSRVTTRLVDDA